MDKLACIACGHETPADPFPERCANCGCVFSRLEPPPPHRAAERLKAAIDQVPAQDAPPDPGWTGSDAPGPEADVPGPALHEPRIEVLIRGQGAAARFRRWVEAEGGAACIFVRIPPQFDGLRDEQTISSIPI